MKSVVYFANFKSKESKKARLERLLSLVDMKEVVSKGDLVALKMHFGEPGNDTFVRPMFVRSVVDAVKGAGGKPFLCDTGTLYTGMRKNAVDHLTTAMEHGFGFEVTRAPIVIVDGLKSNNVADVPVKGVIFESVKIAGDILDADSMVVISHFKGHINAGFGGAVKNLAMGCANAAGKKEQHSAKMVVDEGRCISCGRCVKNCPVEAIDMINSKASIDEFVCIGCGECMTVCPVEAIDLDWTTDRGDFNRRMAEYALGAVYGKKKRVLFVNVMMDITPLCDCVGWSDDKIVPDIGFAMSFDPVALDKACMDLVAAASAASGMKAPCECGQEKFKAIHPHSQPEVQLSHAEKIGLGSMEYELVSI